MLREGKTPEQMSETIRDCELNLRHDAIAAVGAGSQIQQAGHVSLPEIAPPEVFPQRARIAVAGSGGDVKVTRSGDSCLCNESGTKAMPAIEPRFLPVFWMLSWHDLSNSLRQEQEARKYAPPADPVFKTLDRASRRTFSKGQSNLLSGVFLRRMRCEAKSIRRARKGFKAHLSGSRRERRPNAARKRE